MQGAGEAEEPKAGEVSEESVQQLMGMGFAEKKCKKALRETDNNLERAMEWIFSHMDDEGEDEEMTQEKGNTGDIEKQLYKDDKPGLYNLKSFITHLGSSVHAGHYVAHVNKARDSETAEPAWVYFNDAKVAVTNDAPFGKGYMYFFTKK